MSQQVYVIRSIVFPKDISGRGSLLRKELNLLPENVLAFNIYAAFTIINFLNGHK